jgi:HEAT repeat protein
MSQSFSQANLRGNSFKGQDLKGANFSGVDICGASFFHAVNLKNSTQLRLGREMRKIEGRSRRSQITPIISLSLMVGMMGATFLPALAQERIVRVSNRHNAMHLAQLTNPPVPAPGELTKLINDLNHKDLKVRLLAIAKLGSFGPGAKAAVPELISLLQDTDAEVRWNAASALGKIGPGAKAAVPQLMPLLQDTNASVRQIAAYALGEIGSEAKVVVPQLLSLLRDGDQMVRLDAILALSKLETERGAALALLRLLRDPDRETRLAGVQALKDFGPSTVQFVAHHIDIKRYLIGIYDKYQYDEVLSVLHSMGEHKVVARMIANLRDKNVTLNISVLANSLADAGRCVDDYSFGSPKIREVMISALVDHLKDKKSSDRADTASIIGKISPVATSAVPALISALRDRDEGVRRSAVDALQRIDLIALRQVLIANFQHTDKEIQRTAIEEMQFLTKDAALIAALQDKDQNIRQRAINAFLIHPLSSPARLVPVVCAPEVINETTSTTFINAIRRIFRR